MINIELTKCQFNALDSGFGISGNLCDRNLVIAVISNVLCHKKVVITVLISVVPIGLAPNRRFRIVPETMVVRSK